MTDEATKQINEKVEKTCHQHGISEQFYFHLKSKYGGLEIEEALRLNALRDPLKLKIESILVKSLGEDRGWKIKIFLANLKSRLLKLKSWRGWVGLVLRPVLLLLGENAFWHFQNFLSRIEPKRTLWEVPPSDEAKGKEVVNTLKSDGISFWEQMHGSEEFIKQARNTLFPLIEKAHESLRGFPDGVGDIRDYSSGHRFTRDTPVEYSGRTRVRLEGWSGEDGKNMPEWMRSVVEDPRFAQVASNYFGVPACIKRFTVDELLPCRKDLEWHSDTVHDTVKAFIFLTDCGLEDGHTLYGAGSHRVDRPLIRRKYFNMFKYGHPHQYSGPIQYIAPGEIKTGTGKAGDCFFFDNRGLHAASHCVTGKRVVLVLSFSVSSRRNQILSAVKAK